jgi:RNA polymerase sigma factor (sigma-70 family)
VSPLPSSTDSSRALNQDRWFAEEVHPHDSQLKAYLRGSFPSVRDVDDVVQESYLHLWRRQLTAPIRSAKSFLFKIARNLAIDSLRHTRRSPYNGVADLAQLDVLDPKPHAADAACTHDEIECLLDAIESLPPRCREIVILRKLHGLSQKEIAARLGIAERTVEVQGTKGLDRCEEFLRRRGVMRRCEP